MTISARCIRRFKMERNGEAGLEQLARTIELPALPPHDVTLVFEDGTG